MLSECVPSLVTTYILHVFVSDTGIFHKTEELKNGGL